MQERPDDHPAHRDPTEGSRPGNHLSQTAPPARSPLVWLLPTLPLIAALMLVSWPLPRAATGATTIYEAAFPTAAEIAASEARHPAPRHGRGSCDRRGLHRPSQDR